MLTHFINNNTDGYNGDAISLMDVVDYADFQGNHLATAIIDLHEKGYSQDFMVSGQYLFWAQEKNYIRANDFCIIECLRFDNPDEKNIVLLILGILATDENVKGIVLYYYNYNSQIPRVLADKLRNIKSDRYK